MIATVVALPYELARLPLVLLDSNLSDKLPETFGPRVALDRAIGSADRVAGAWLHNPGIARRGAERIKHSDDVLAAARLETYAAGKRRAADETATSGLDEAREKRDAAQQRAATGLREADAAEARSKEVAAAKADATAAAKKAAADKRAKARKAAAAKRKAQADSAANAEKQTAQRAAKTGIDEAREAKASATEARADAERLDELAEAKKRERKQD